MAIDDGAAIKGRRLGLVALSIVVVAGIFGCSAGPGAAGFISLAPGVDPTGFQTLAVRAYPNPAGGFDPAAPIPAHSLVLNRSLATVAFPLLYMIGAGTGETEVATWQLVAWLSRRPPQEITGLDPGDVYCTRPFETYDCGRSNDELCDPTPMVDCILSTVAP